MQTRRFLLLGFVAAVLTAAPAASAAPNLPDSIAGIGDSITRGTDVCCWYGDHPAQSWSTGNYAYDGIRSHYERLRALNPVIADYNFNVSASGARASDLPAQVQAAVAQNPQYVTILIGANDLCTSSASTMTSAAE